MPRGRGHIVTLSALLIFIFIYHLFHLLQKPHPPHTVLPANSTLGFGTILAVSHATSPRRPGLLWAANLTDIDIVIPALPTWTERDISAFKAREGYISNGSAKAWMSHLHVLHHFLNTRHSTALILEDDTDFSLSLRNTQIPLLAAALRTLTNTSLSTSTHTSNTNANPHYWSPSSTWDILYPGHCDDNLSPLYTSSSPSSPHLTYTDTTTPPPTSQHPQTSLFLSSLSVPPHARVLHRNYWPFCTFAYGVTRASAARILRVLGKEKEGGTSAFDVALLEGCRDGGWRCWSVSPEIFHHRRGGSEIGRVDWEGLRGEGGGEMARGGGEGRREKRDGRGTWNLECGARHAQLWVGEGDGEGRRKMKWLVDGMKGTGKCPVDLARQERSCKGCEWEECGAQS